jgi:hypothetical protein
MIASKLLIKLGYAEPSFVCGCAFSQRESIFLIASGQIQRQSRLLLSTALKSELELTGEKK